MNGTGGFNAMNENLHDRPGVLNTRTQLTNLQRVVLVLE